MPPKGSKKTEPKTSKPSTSNSAKELLNQFYTEDEKGKYFAFYKQFRRKQVVVRGVLKEKAENLNYGSIYQKWVDLKRGLVEIPLVQLTIACKCLFQFFFCYSCLTYEFTHKTWVLTVLVCYCCLTYEFVCETEFFDFIVFTIVVLHTNLDVRQKVTL